MLLETQNEFSTGEITSLVVAKCHRHHRYINLRRWFQSYARGGACALDSTGMSEQFKLDFYRVRASLLITAMVSWSATNARHYVQTVYPIVSACKVYIMPTTVRIPEHRPPHHTSHSSLYTLQRPMWNDFIKNYCMFSIW